MERNWGVEKVSTVGDEAFKFKQWDTDALILDQYTKFKSNIIFSDLLNKIKKTGLVSKYEQGAMLYTKVEELIHLMEELLSNVVIPGELKLMNLSTTLKDGITPIKWRVEKLIPERGVVFFGGTAGCYKTWSAMDLAMCCATGKPFLNFFDVEKCKVLYIDEENGDITLPNRFDMLRKGHLLEHDDLKDIELSIFNNVKLDTIDGKNAIDDAISQNDFKLVVIDSMVRCIDGEENNATDVKTVFNNLKDIFSKHRDVVFVILHHTTKSGKGMDALRGSGDFAASADVVLMFETGHKGFVNINIAKNRHIDMSEFNRYSVAIHNYEKTGGLGFVYMGDNAGYVDEISRCVESILEWLSDTNIGSFRSGQTISEMSRKGYKKTTINDALKKLHKSGEITKQKQGQWAVVGTVFDVENEK